MKWRTEESDTKITIYVNESDIPEPLSMALDDELHRICSRARVTRKNLVVDFRDVESTSSAILGKVVVLNEYLKSHDLDLRLANVRGAVRDIFRSTNLDKVFFIDNDDDDDDAPATHH